MIKRRFYKDDHGDNSGTSESSSSDDSDSFKEVDAEEDHNVEEEEVEEGGEEERGRGSGYESEDSSINQGDVDTSDMLINEEDMTGENKKGSKIVGMVPDNEVEIAPEMTRIKIHPIQTDISKFILKFKSVFKCRLCPRILCLNEDTVRTHLSSKRHARSKKLHDEGRLKLMLNSDGELEEEQETHAERHARILALSQKSPPKKKDNGRKRKNKRMKKTEIPMKVLRRGAFSDRCHGIALKLKRDAPSRVCQGSLPVIPEGSIRAVDRIDPLSELQKSSASLDYPMLEPTPVVTREGGVGPASGGPPSDVLGEKASDVVPQPRVLPAPVATREGGVGPTSGGPTFMLRNNNSIPFQKYLGGFAQCVRVTLLLEHFAVVTYRVFFRFWSDRLYFSEPE